MSNIGIMEGAYFVGRVELLNWLNDLLKLDYTKVEQTCSGAAHCQIMDALYPGKVPLSKVKFDAKQEYEFIANFKVLQTVFDKLGIDKAVDVPKLVKGKYQDNLEFLQWMKRYFDLNYSGGEYNAVERRKGGGGGSAPEKKVAPAPMKKVEPSVKKVAPTKSIGKTATTPTKKPVSKSPEPSATAPTKQSSSSDDKKVQELTQSVAELKATIEGLEKERDFYFGKLRDIEILCQQSEDQNVDAIQKIFKILYATDDEGAFAADEQAQEEPPAEEIESF